MIPDFVTHYHAAGRAPFLNLSDLPPDRLEVVIRALEQERVNGTSVRVFGRRYMDLRRLTEEKLRLLFTEAGGRPQRTSPHYFVLGSSPWYRGLADEMEEVVLKLEELPPEATSFTYPDSFTSMGLGADFGLHHDPRPYHQTVFRLDQLAEVVERYGLPADEGAGYARYQFEPFERYIEVQVWSDAPVIPQRPASTSGS